METESRVHIYRDDQPTYVAISANGGPEGFGIAVPAATLSDWQRVTDECERVQAEMAAIYERERA